MKCGSGDSGDSGSSNNKPLAVLCVWMCACHPMSSYHIIRPIASASHFFRLAHSHATMSFALMAYIQTLLLFRLPSHKWRKKIRQFESENDEIKKKRTESEYSVVAVDVEFQQFSINKVVRRNLYTNTSKRQKRYTEAPPSLFVRDLFLSSSFLLCVCFFFHLYHSRSFFSYFKFIWKCAEVSE